jgi:general secretion pathway protein G
LLSRALSWAAWIWLAIVPGAYLYGPLASLYLYFRHLPARNESVLRSNLFSLRTVIQNYTYDKKRGPKSLQELVSSGYLREVPTDPITRSKQWRTTMNATQSPNQPGIVEVRSMSGKSGLDGTPYSEW